MRIIKSEIGDFFKSNAKVVVSVAAVFLVGIALGVTLAFRAVGGEFETVARVDADVGAGKVFLLSLIILAGCYGLILLSCANKKTVFLCCVPYLALGFMLGRFSAALICRYELFGLLNFLFVYLPAFIFSLILLLFATVRALTAGCCERCETSRFKPSFLDIVKLFALNAAVCFVFFIIAGALVGGVIIPSLF